MKYFNSILILVAVVGAATHSFASVDSCQNIISNRMKDKARRAGDWSFEGLNSASKIEAIEAIQSASSDNVSDEKRESSLKKANEADRLFYILDWTAPSNSGASVLVVKASTCRILSEVAFSSEE